MNPREMRESLEPQLVGPYGIRAADSRGRLISEPPCTIRTCFQRDVDRITHCKSFRRLKHKTQVFLQPEGDHASDAYSGGQQTGQNGRAGTYA